jgi:hypothetical protein
LGALHGKIDGFVFRKQGDKTLCYRLPERTQPFSEKQKKTIRTFSDASHWVRTVVKPDPALRALYRKRGCARRKGRRNFRQMAIRDFFHAPEVNGLEFQHYQPATGGRLVIHATDDFEVVRVTVALRDTAGMVFSSGNAVLANGAWRYDAPALPATGQLPVTAEVTAYDRPGNATTKCFVLADAEKPVAPPVLVKELIRDYVCA